MKFVFVGPRFNLRDVSRVHKLQAPWVAVDGGLDFIDRIGDEPLFAVGDWDSLKNKKLLNQVDHITLPVRKDRNDLYYALESIKSVEPSEIHLYGFDLGRIDHELSNLFELAQFVERNPSVHIVYERRDETLILLSQSQMKPKLKKGQTVSFFSLGSKPAENVTLKGFEYPLHNEKLKPSSLALSNQVLTTRCQISVGRGVLMMIINQ